MMNDQPKTREQVKEELYRRGITIASWAKKNGFTADQVRDVLRKPGPCRFGYSHKIAVLMGIKEGSIEDA